MFAKDPHGIQLDFTRGIFYVCTTYQSRFVNEALRSLDFAVEFNRALQLVFKKLSCKTLEMVISTD